MKREFKRLKGKPMARSNGTRKSADRTFREESLERFTALETGTRELERRFDAGYALMRERVEGIQIALGSRIDEMKHDMVHRLDDIHSSVRSQALPVARRLDGHDKTIAKLDRWYNRHAGATSVIAAAVTLAAILFGTYLKH